MKKLLTLVCLSTLSLPLVTASFAQDAAQASVTSTTQSGEKNMVQQPPTVSIRASAETQLQQDTIKVSLVKEVVNTDKNVVNKALADAVNFATQKAKAFDGKMQFKTGRYNVWLNSYQKKKEWVGTAEVHVESKDFEAVTQFISLVQEQMNVSDVRFDLSQEIREKAIGDIRKKAIQSFRDKAQAIAKEFGYQGYDLAQVSVDDKEEGHTVSMRMAAYAASSASLKSAAPAPEFSAGKQALEVTVKGSIYLK